MGNKHSRAVAKPPKRGSIADALFTQTQQRVLSLLFGQPARSFYTKEVIDLAGGGSGGVQRELARLQQSGLVVQTALGTQKHYQANAASPIFGEMCGIATKILGPADTLRSALVPIAEHVELALVYGSIAARRDSAGSDVDLLIVADALTLEDIYAALAPAEKKLGRAVNPTVYTPADFRKRLAKRNSFLLNVLASDTIALIGEKDAAAGAG